MKALNRKEQKEQTRQKLIATSLRVFATQNISATNTAELAKYAKVSHGTIFLHFPTRDDLLFAVIDEFGNQLAASFDEAARTSKGVIGILKAHLKTLKEFEGVYTHLVIELPHLPRKVRSRFFIVQAAISHRIYTEIEQEIKLGKIKNIEQHKLFNTWVALLHYYMANKELFCGKQSIISSVGNELLKHFLTLIKR